MGNKYRSPFVYDGRAEAGVGASADAGDMVVVYDNVNDETKTYTLTELGAALSAVGAGGGWIPTPETPINFSGTTNPTYDIQASDAGKHLILVGQGATQTASGTQMDFDALPDGEWVHITFAWDDDSAGAPEVVGVTLTGTNQLGGWGSPGGITSYDDVNLLVQPGAGLTISFYNDGGTIKIIGPSVSVDINPQSGP